MAKQKNAHVGGQQLPLLTPYSSWQAAPELPDLRKHRRIAIDTENKDDGLRQSIGPGWATGMGFVCGLAVAWREGKSYVGEYFPIRHPDTEGLFTKDQIARWLRAHLKAGVRIVMQNAPYDWGWIWKDLGVEPPEGDQIDDTTAMAVMLDENRIEGYDLNSLCRWQGIPGKNEDLLTEAAAAYGYHGGKDVKSNLWRLPARYVGPYGQDDAVQTLQLADIFDPLIDAEGTREAYQLECDLIPMTVAMRMRGVRIDTDYCELGIRKLRAERDSVLKELSEKLGHTTGIDDVNSWKFMARACDSVGVQYPRTAKTGQPSFGKEWTRKHPHWLPRLADRAQQLELIASKFLQGFLLNYSNGGRVHASINQFRSDEGGTRSHRFSYSDPALQQMPSRDEEFKDFVRGAFLPEEGEYWAALDYSQQEYRLIVHYAEVHRCGRATEAGDQYRTDPRTDFHTMVAEMTGLDRKPAKDTNFAKAFGAGVKKFALMIGKSVEEAQAIYDQYDQKMPFVKELANRCASAANAKGYILLIDKARSHFDHWEAADQKLNYGDDGKYIAPRPLAAAKRVEQWENARLRRAYTHKAMNRKIQGSAARMTKIAMRDCWREKLLPMLQMHDELDFSFGDERTALRAKELMRDAVKLTVPVVVDLEWGRNWGDAKHEWKDLDKGGRRGKVKKR